MAKVLLSAAFALIAAAIAFAVGPANAAAPDMSFGAAVMGFEHPVLVAVANVVWWSLKVLAVAGFLMWVLSRPRIRDRITAGEYNEAIALRRRYIGDGGAPGMDTSAKLSVGEAIYIVGVLALDKIIAIVLTVLAINASTVL